MSDTIQVEVVFALPQRCWRRRITLTAGTTAGEALRASGLDAVYHDHAGDTDGDEMPPLGVFGRKIKPDQVLADGDRLEVYRPLTADPRQRRRARVEARRRGDVSGAG